MANTMDSLNLPPEILALPPEVLAQLVKTANERVSTTTVAYFSVPTFVYLCILYFSAKVVEFILGRHTQTFNTLSLAHRRTCTIYVLNTVYTTVALALQLAASPALAEHYTENQFDYMRLATMIISGLYLFEMTYREEMRWPMLIHHFATLGAIFLVVATQDKTLHPSLLVSGVLWLFQATTEQAVFVGLFMYRFSYPAKTVSTILCVGAVQSLVLKLGFALYLLVWWGIKQAKNHARALDIVFSCFLVILVLTLMGCQIWGAWVVWVIGRSIPSRYSKNRVSTQEKVESDSKSIEVEQIC